MRTLAAVLMSFLAAVPALANTQTVDFSPLQNRRMQSFSPFNAQYFPEGEVLLGGIPFSIPSGGNNIWQSLANVGQPDYVDIPVSCFGVSGVHMLINTHGGVTGGPYVFIEFFAAGGAYYTKDLYGNDDVRDYYENWYTNSINGTTTTEVFTYGSGYQNEVRLDKQWIDLPAAFDSDTLVRIRLTDIGAPGPGQQPFLAGVTLEAPPVPEPVTMLSTFLSVGVVGWYSRTRARKALLSDA